MGDEQDLTEFAGIAGADTEAVEAWALCPDDDPQPRFTQRQIVTAVGAVAVLGCAAVIAALVWVAYRPTAASSASTSAPTSSLVPATTSAPPVVAAPPPPVVAPPPALPPATVTVTRPPPVTVTATPTGLPAAEVAAYDRQFLNKLQVDGWTITNPESMTKNAHIVCAKLQQGQTVAAVNGQLMDKAGMSSTEALMFSSAAMLTYPSCP